MKPIRQAIAMSFFAATAILSSASWASGPAGGAQGFFYVDIPLGGLSKGLPSPTFGLMLSSHSNSGSSQFADLRSTPLVDYRFNGRLRGLRVVGIDVSRQRLNIGEQTQAEQAQVENPDAINWWVVGPVMGVAAIVIAVSSANNGPRCVKSSFDIVCG